MMDESDQKPMVARYRLKARGFLNSISNRRAFEGALIQVDGGFGCIHPWPELGDPPLEKCLTDLAGARRWPIVRRALRCAEYDRAARTFEHSLFEEMEIPQSHATIAQGKVEDVVRAVEAGFSVVKLKAGRNGTAERKLLEEMSGEYAQLRWRLDFNESLTPEEVVEYVEGLSEKTRGAIDFLEDPCPYSDGMWKDLQRKLRVKFGVDRESAPLSGAARVMVVKSAVDEPFLLGEAALGNGQKVVVTSYMDHPVGQTFAAWEAARLGLQFPGLVGVCGLQTHELFEPNEFTEWMGPWGPEFVPPAGLGLGFDDLLDSLPWTRLY